MSLTPTPRRSLRWSHVHTPKMTDRKKGLFQDTCDAKDSLIGHRRLPVVESESDNEDYDLGIISTLDSSSSDEMYDHSVPRTPEYGVWHGTRSHTPKILKDSHNLKNFMKSPFTLKKFQSHYSNMTVRGDSFSTPSTPQVPHQPGTPSSTHSCASACTLSSGHSRARKSLASLIADTESCSSSLKDLNFDSDSATDSKENTPSKQATRRSCRKIKMTPKFASFKGVLAEQKRNVASSPNLTVDKTILDKDCISPTQMQKTPLNQTQSDTPMSPRKINHNRRAVVEIAESPDDTDDNDKGNKRLRDSSESENGPTPKHQKLDSNSAPKARLSLFNSDRLKEILSVKSFYGKSNPELTTSFTRKVASAVIATTTNPIRHIRHQTRRSRSRRPGQINMGVRHRIKKPKIHSKVKPVGYKGNPIYVNTAPPDVKIPSVAKPLKNNPMLSETFQADIDNDKADPFDSEKQTIASLLSQWTEEEVPEHELAPPSRPRVEELACFDRTLMEETNPIFPPVTAVPVSAGPGSAEDEGERVIMELGGVTHSDDGHPKTAFTGDGGFDENKPEQGQEELLDLDMIEKELKMLDEQILQMAQKNNIDASAVLASTETPLPSATPAAPAASDQESEVQKNKDSTEASKKLFPIFHKSTVIPATPTSSKGATEKTDRKFISKKVTNQYVIDAGQKKFGATQCTECGVIYEIGDPQDEYAHLVHHNATDVLRFNGWKEEDLVGCWGDGARCLRVRGGGAGWRKVQQLLERVVHPQLGYNAVLPRQTHVYTAYLYIEKKQIVGCIVMEPKTRAHRLLPGEPDCISDETYPVKAGVSRVWVSGAHRRSGRASRMLDCARASLLLGDPLPRDMLAYSAPTAAGRRFARAYCRSGDPLVYLD